jgi:uncharacterized protein YbcV (DUF1398 family)
MDADLAAVARRCLAGAETNEMTFPEIVGTLMQAGFEAYMVDFRRGTASYYLPNGETLDLPLHQISTPMGTTFDADAIKNAIRAAQQQAPGYTYLGFCETAVTAGCASYLVSFPGRRALYIGRTGETHTELFPD